MKVFFSFTKNRDTIASTSSQRKSRFRAHWSPLLTSKRRVRRSLKLSRVYVFIEKKQVLQHRLTKCLNERILQFDFNGECSIMDWLHFVLLTVLTLLVWGFIYYILHQQNVYEYESTRRSRPRGELGISAMKLGAHLLFSGAVVVIWGSYFEFLNNHPILSALILLGIITTIAGFLRSAYIMQRLKIRGHRFVSFFRIDFSSMLTKVRFPW